MLVMSMVSPHQCMKPATSMDVKRTHIITKMEPRQLPSVIKVVMNIQTGQKRLVISLTSISLLLIAIPIFLISSIPTIASVSQLMYVKAIGKESLLKGVS